MKNCMYFSAIFILALHLLFGSCKIQISMFQGDSIYSVQKKEFGDSMDIKALNYYREQSKWFEKLNHSNKEDTIFILERPGIQGNFSFTFWNKRDTVTYTNATGSFEFKNEPSFTNYMMKLVSEWNITEIRLEENLHSNLLPSEMVYATIIIVKDKKCKIDCIRFKDFFKLERDR